MIRVLFTGASSFTGAWFVTALAAAGAEVVAPCRGGGPDAAGAPDRRQRLARVAGRCRLVPDAAFGSPAFLGLVRAAGPFDLLCHHGAKAGDHRDPGLDPLAAAAAPCRELAAVLEALQAGGCRAALLTGTVFEADAGAGGPTPRRAIGPYGLAKTLTWQIFRYHAEALGLPVAKFVVANPIGPLEKPGLCRGLAEAWLDGRAAVLNRPQLVRDQLQVEGLAAAYAAFALALAADPGSRQVTPSQYPERLDRFAARLAAAMGPRLGIPCRFSLAEPPEPATEPLARVGIEPLATLVPGFDAEAAWDRHAAWLLSRC